MLRIASLAILAITVPTYAQSRRAGPGNLDQKLNQILERLERLEQRVEAKESHPDRDRGRHADRRRGQDRRHDGDRRGPRGRPDMQRGPRGPRGPMRGPDMRGRGGPQKGQQGRPQMGQQPFGKLPQIIQAARKGDPRATQMLTRVRKAIDDALRSGHGPKGKPARRAKSAAPPTKAAGFRLVKPTAKLDVNEIDYAGKFYLSNAQAVKKAEIARRKAEVHKAHADMVRREKMAKAHYEKLERKAKAGRKKGQKDDYARVKKLVAESERLQEEIRRLRAELGAQRR